MFSLRMWITAVFIVSQLFISAITASANDSQKIRELIAKGDRSRALGQMNSALEAYNEAIRLDSTNYLVLFKRGAMYMNIPGKENSAIADFTTVIELRPSFEGALKQRGSLYVKLGKLEEAEKDADLLKKSEIKKQKKQEADSEQQETKSFSDQLLGQVGVVRNAIEASSHLNKTQDADGCVQSATEGLGVAPFSTKLLKIRIDCNVKRGMARAAVRDFNSLEILLTAEDIYAHDARILYYALDESDTAITKLQKCFRLNMDSKPCKAAFTELRSHEKKIGKYAGIADAKKSNDQPKYSDGDKIWKEAKEAVLPKLESEVRTTVKEAYKIIGFPDSIDSNTHSKLISNLEETICVSFYNLKQYEDANAKKYCDQVISRGSALETLGDTQATPSNDVLVVAYLLMVEKYISEQAFDKAHGVIDSAPDRIRADRRLATKKNEIELHRTRAKNTDYYKILGISRSANDKEIRSAYREKTKQYHPDKYRGELNADEVDRKMAEVNQAYEVLSTPELRARFDRGDDPNNNELKHNHNHGGDEQMRQFFRGANGAGANQQFFQQFGGFDFGGGQRQGGAQKFKFTMNHGHARQRRRQQ